MIIMITITIMLSFKTFILLSVSIFRLEFLLYGHVIKGKFQRCNNHY